VTETIEVPIDESINLSGHRILVVEDDVAVGYELCSDLKRYGATVLGPAPTSHYAYLLLMGRRGVDGAVLHLDPYRRELYELAEALQRRGVPMIFAIDGDNVDLSGSFRDTPRLAKPLHSRELAQAITRMIQAGPVTQQPQIVAKPPELSLTERMDRAVARAMRHAIEG
jgi:hypothetical protein